MNTFRAVGRKLCTTVSLAGVITLAALLGTGSAEEATETEIDPTQLTLQELMEYRVAKVVAASRHEQRTTEAPASVTVITADEISKFGYRTLADILTSVPGVYITYDRNYSFLGVRGFGRPGDFNSRVLLLIDGHRINDNIYNTAPIGTDFPLDIALISHVEFIRGPGSSLYGSNAFFGVINVVTRKAEDISRELAFTAGNYGTWKGRASYGAKYDSGLQVVLSGTVYDSEGQTRLFYPEYASDPNGPVYRNNDYDSSKSFYSRFALGDFTLSGLYQTREKGIPTGSYGTAFNSRPNYTVDDSGYADLSYRRKLGEAAEVTARLYYQESSYIGKYTYDLFGGLPYVINQDRARGRWWGAEAVAVLTPVRGHRFTLGAELQHNLTIAQSNFDESPYANYLDDKRSSINWGTFIQDEYRIFQQVLLNVGLRYDKYDRFDTINPRAALIYQPTPASTVKLMYGEAFRAPTPYELHYDYANIASKANRVLQPEKIHTYEAVYEHFFDETYNMSVSSFYYQIDNLISQRADANGHLTYYNNLNAVETTGMEVSLQATWEDGLRGRVSYTWQEASSANPEVKRNSPHHLAKAGLTIPVYKTFCFVSPELNYTGPRLTKSGNRTKDVVVTNLTLFSRDLIKGLEASAGIYNLFDATYGDPGGNEHRQDIINQDGINFRVNLTYRF